MLLVIDASRIMQAGAHWPALAALPRTTSALELVTLTVADCFGTLSQTINVFRQYLKHYHALDVSFSAGGLMLFPCGAYKTSISNCLHVTHTRGHRVDAPTMPYL